jgi:hypothetical protein
VTGYTSPWSWINETMDWCAAATSGRLVS